MTKSTILAALFVLLLAPYGARPQGVPECSCSPKAFQFFISSLDTDCEKNDIVNNSGISEATTACFIEGGSPPDPPILGIEEEGKTPEELNPDFKVNNITSIIFKEFDKDDNTISETKQNYRGTPLENGNQINLFSISSTLSTMSSLEDQIGRVPYRVEIRLFGYNEAGELISNIIRWSYDMSCGSDPIQTGDTIGRITIGDLIGPWPKFCPNTPAPSPGFSMSHSMLSKASKATTKVNKVYNSRKGDREDGA